MKAHFTIHRAIPLLTIAITVMGNSLAGAGHHTMQTASKNLVETAVSAGQFNTLVAAVEAAGLVDALSGDGPLTVFAPTDEAFAKLPAGTVDELLKPRNRDKLRAILTYHVAPERLTASDVVSRRTVPTLNGQRPRVEKSHGEVQVGGARVTATDIMASNGVIHVIDEVLLPVEGDLVDVAASADGFSTLVAAVHAAGLVEALRGEGPLTVFAPTDDAFSNLPSGTLDELLRPENRDRLRAILSYHVVPGAVFSDDASDGARLASLEGSKIRVSARHSSLAVDNARIVATDIGASNGVIHVIDSVIIPEGPRAATASPARDLIRMAISHGAPSYNQGQHAACASMYSIAATALVTTGGGGLTSTERERLERALSEAEHSSSASDRAWALRHAFDDVLMSIDNRMAMAP